VFGKCKKRNMRVNGMKTNQVIEVALKAGEILLTGGAEIYRVEDTVIRICKSYNVEAECFVLPTGIFITVMDSEGNPISIVRRIRKRTVNLEKVEKINSFSRSLQNNPLSYREAMTGINSIMGLEGYSYALKLLVAGITPFVYALLFKGTAKEACASFLIGIVIYAIKEKITRAGVFEFFEYFISGLAAGILSVLTIKLYPLADLYRIIIASIIILLPGLAITNAIKDALYGDIVSSMFRLTEAVFVAAAVGVGVALALTIGLRWI
jgi:uncharacterized membrane protein YjjP (DUF1212 family)